MKSFEDYENEAAEQRSRVEVWKDPEREARLYDMAMEKVRAEQAIEATEVALAQLTLEATRVVEELLHDKDPQVRARAVDIVYSRTIRKVAAKHLEENTISVQHDVEALRESVFEEINKRAGKDAR